MQVRQSLLDQRVRAMSKHGTVNYFELVVSSKSFSQLVDRVVVMQDIVRSDQLLLQTLKSERDQLEALRQRLDVQRSEEASLLRQQQEQQAQLQVTLGDQEAALAYYASLEAQFDQQRRELEAEKARFDDLVVQLQRQYDNQARGYGGGSGQFAWPERGPITQGFGCTDFLGALRPQLRHAPLPHRDRHRSPRRHHHPCCGRRDRILRGLGRRLRERGHRDPRERVQHALRSHVRLRGGNRRPGQPRPADRVRGIDRLFHRSAPAFRDSPERRLPESA
jgi:hypothetical protein